LLKLAIIILNYRTPGLVTDCLASLEGEVEAGPGEVLVVDNASDDGSADAIEKTIDERGWNRWARVIRSPVNGGFAAGNNLGIRAAEAGAYLLLNSDTIVRPGAIAAMLAELGRDPAVGLVGPRLVGADGRRQTGAFRSPTPISEFLAASATGPLDRICRRHVVPIHELAAAEEPDWLSFAAVLIRREVIEQIGLLDDGFFMYYEDVDFCRRARAAGWKLRSCPEAQVVHLHGQSSDVPRTITERKRLPRYYYQARARYFRKYYGLGGLWAANVLWGAGHGVSLLRRVLQGRPDHAARRQLWDNWIGAWKRSCHAAAVGERLHP
jgi:N-acetylglucosaminyl-diphospho-decaprenol L-rhamnosyltransferase